MSTHYAGSLDANVVLRLLLNDVPAQNQAAIKYISNAKGKLWVAEIAVVEVVFVLERNYKFTREQIREAIEGLTALRQLHCSQELFKYALEIFIARKSLSIEDCCLAAYAKLYQVAPLLTFDKKLARQSPHTRLL